jgi:hypothetical protein
MAGPFWLLIQMHRSSVARFAVRRDVRTMGYDVHVTRRRGWWDDDGPQISVGDGEALSDGRSELKELVRYSNGNSVAKNPDRERMLALLGLARELDARVQGDDGEIYTFENLDALEQARPERGVRQWLLFLRPYLLFGVVWFIVVTLVLWLAGLLP